MTADIVEMVSCVEPYTCGVDCSHMFWHCTSCDESGGEGLPVEELKELTYQHNHVECVAMYEEF
jgi:hypothetical protein